ncbi:MAG: hypothetical protein QJR07_15670 [Acetobacteraceae bacterium]|nr:hypothetical protein [Acetobacteraceae bacterium]
MSKEDAAARKARTVFASDIRARVSALRSAARELRAALIAAGLDVPPVPPLEFKATKPPAKRGRRPIDDDAALAEMHSALIEGRAGSVQAAAAPIAARLATLMTPAKSIADRLEAKYRAIMNLAWDAKQIEEFRWENPEVIAQQLASGRDLLRGIGSALQQHLQGTANDPALAEAMAPFDAWLAELEFRAVASWCAEVMPQMEGLRATLAGAHPAQKPRRRGGRK